MNVLQPLLPLRNAYYVLRHGRSLANDAGLIISDPQRGVSGYGLSEKGREEVARSVAEIARSGALDATTVIVTSDFARARESAEIAADLLGARELISSPKLRERFFGKWDGTHPSNYTRVWEHDRVIGAGPRDGVESARDVLERMTSLLNELEREYSGRRILLVSHGDPLQVLQTAFDGRDPGEHRLLPPLQTGEVRRMELRPVRR